MKKQIKKFETLTQMNDVNLIGGFSTVLQYSLLNGNPAFAANNETKGNNCQAMNCVGCGSPTNSATQCTSL